ncbi:MAG: branched-chain amino acid ABC transporter permease [Anaerolineae bacterium]|nr:branched-chain amino acid ABC transporter permease [Anaerolineae bacterium]
MKRNLLFLLGVVVITAVLLLIGVPVYTMHILVQVLLWGAICSGWTLLGRFGITSMGHGAFVGIGAYGVVLLWNHLGITPWLGVPIAAAAAMLLAFAVGYPCFKLRVVGRNFSLVTMAMAVVVQLTIIAARDVTGGSLGLTPKAQTSAPLLALQFPNKNVAFLFALGFWLVVLWVMTRLNASMTSLSLAASAEQEDAAEAIGINVAREKLKVLLLSAAVTAVGGALLGQYLMYINPETLSGSPVSLQILYASIAGGMYTVLGPTIGSGLTLALTESLRVLFGTRFIGAANTIYGLMLILFVIFMPQGIWGTILSKLQGRTSRRARSLL